MFYFEEKANTSIEVEDMNDFESYGNFIETINDSAFELEDWDVGLDNITLFREFFTTFLRGEIELLKCLLPCDSIVDIFAFETK